MDLYSFALWLGFAGLVVMAFVGVAGGHGVRSQNAPGVGAHGAQGSGPSGFHLSGANGHGTGAHGTGGHGPGGHGVARDMSLHGHATHHHTPANQSSPGAHAPISMGTRLLNWLSPRALFAVSLGAGATGLLSAPYLSLEPLRGFVALVGGIGLEKLVISPLWGTLLRFASRPARTLETAVLEDATAVTSFDKDGCGLIAIDLDGHEMRVLGRLRPEQRAQRVRAGDRLIVEEVDTVRNQCRVALPETPV